MRNDKEPVKIVPKGWGNEVWIHNDNRYCGKILNFKKGKRLSLHFHGIKTETWWLSFGLVDVYYYDNMELDPKFHNWQDLEMAANIGLEGLNHFRFTPGNCFHIPQGRRHAVIALEDSTIFEASSEHFDFDTDRILIGNTL